jgi:hypothetical protein
MKNQKNKESLDTFSDVKEETVTITVKLNDKLPEGVKFNKDTIARMIQKALVNYGSDMCEAITQTGDYEDFEYIATQVIWEIK